MVVHEPGDWFGESLAALAAQDHPNVRSIFFVTSRVGDAGPDLARSDEVRARILEVLPSAVVRIVEGNPGFAPLVNEALHLVEGDAGLVCLLHDDVAPRPDALSAMARELYRSNAGVVGPKVVDWDDPTRLVSVGGEIDRCGEVDPLVEPGERDQEQHDAVRDTFFVGTSCMLVRLDLFRELGGLAPEIQLLGEDVEFCWRVHLAGARVLFVPAAVVRERERVAERDPARLAAAARHRVRTVATLSGAAELPRLAVRLVVTAFAQTVVGFLTGQSREGLAALRATLALPLDLPLVRRRRAAVRPLRRVAAAEIRKLQLRGSARIARFLRRRRAVGGPRDLGAALDVRDRSAARVTLAVALAVAALCVLGGRGLLAGRPGLVGDLVPFAPDGRTPRDLLGAYLSGFWPAGFGDASAQPTLVGLLGLAGVVAFGRLGGLATWTLVSAPFVAFLGMWRLGALHQHLRARLAGAVVYAALPVGAGAIAAGRLGALVTWACLPWVLDAMRRLGLTARTPDGAEVGVSSRRRSQILAGLIVALACVAALAPPFLLVVLAAATAWALVDATAPGRARRALGAWASVVLATLGAAAAHLPWALHFVSRDAWTLIVGDAGATARGLGVGTLARLDGGTQVLAPLGWGVLGLLPVAVLVGRGPRFVAAAQGALLALVGAIVAVLDDLGRMPLDVPEPTVLLACVACGAALAAGACIAAIDDGGGWRRAAALLAPLAVAAAVVPAIVGVADGRWHQPAATPLDLLTQLPDDDALGNSRTLLLGRADDLPVAARSAGGALAYGVAIDGPLDATMRFAPEGTAMDDIARLSVAALADNGTTRFGRLVAPLAVRHVVVVGTGALRDRLVALLGNQLDLRRAYLAGDLAIFENVAWIPLASRLDDDSAVLSRRAALGDAPDRDVRASDPLFVASGDPTRGSASAIRGGVVHVAVPYAPEWTLLVDGVRIAPRPAFGATVGFDAPVTGVARLEFTTPPWRALAVAMQGLAWLGLAAVAFDARRIRARWRGEPPPTVRVLAAPATDAEPRSV
jgi:GT2 family glycosyltransferase